LNMTSLFFYIKNDPYSYHQAGIDYRTIDAITTLEGNCTFP